MNTEIVNLLWAKSDPFVSLKKHMLSTGICMRIFLTAPSSNCILSYLAKNMGMPKDRAASFLSYLAAVHDLGKAHPCFQFKDKKLFAQLKSLKTTLVNGFIPKDNFRHEFETSEALKRIWKKSAPNSTGRDLYAYILSLHHQKPHGKQQKPDSKWQQIQEEIENEIRHVFYPDLDFEFPEMTDATAMLITSLIILSDWTASSDFFADAEKMSNEDICRQAKKALAMFGLIDDCVFPEIHSFNEMWPQIRTPRPLQVGCDKLSEKALLSIVEAPMGEGKTETAFALGARICNAYGKRGIYMALPSQATSNQMHGRMDAMLDTLNYGSSRLLHGTAFLEETYDHFQTEDEAIAGKWTRPMRMGLLSTNAVGTVDQAMAGVLMQKFSMIRMMGLSEKVLIIDEIHAYDMYMSEILEILLCWCRDMLIPVILLSATLQQKQKERYLACYGADNVPSDSYPQITQVLPDKKLIQMPVDASAHYYYDFVPCYGKEDPEELAAYAMKKIESGGCLAILVNTVKQAQKVFSGLVKFAEKDVELQLFHSRFTVKRREEIEKQCIRSFGKDRSARPKKGILVATQVVEQSIDLDFDGMISELAPIDLLLQRAGRLHRHRENSRPAGFETPRLEVLMPGKEAKEDLKYRYGGSGMVYDPYLLYNTEQMLKQEKRIRVPEDMRTVIEDVYETVTDKNREAWLERTVISASCALISRQWDFLK